MVNNSDHYIYSIEGFTMVTNLLEKNVKNSSRIVGKFKKLLVGDLKFLIN